MSDSVLRKNKVSSPRLLAGVMVAAACAAADAHAADPADDWVIGVRLRVGWKYDDVRMCGATGPGAPHGPDIDISAFGEVPLGDSVSLDTNIPVFRPILFALGADMVQFEPEATLLFRGNDTGDTQLVAGPSLGISIHFGPDYNSAIEGSGRTASFWAIGPRVGGYLGLDFVRPNERFNYQLGLHPYVTRLLSINDPEGHRGWVLGVTLDNSFRFHADSDGAPPEDTHPGASPLEPEPSPSTTAGQGQ